jgi:hypothetical protein
MQLEGQLDEAFYQDTRSISDFIQSVPDEGVVATERTEAWIAFDHENIYVFARVWDSAPGSEWVANELRRNTNQLRQNDTFGVMFDTFYDRRNGVMFYTNPLGALAEFAMTNEGNPNNDFSADVGLDLKIGITDNLTSDFTYNTDFAQVEVDERQVNLTRFSLFISRTEGVLSRGTGNLRLRDPRRKPRLRPWRSRGRERTHPVLQSTHRARGGVPVPIRGGGRVTGKVGSFDIGALSIQTDDVEGAGIESTNFTVLRLRRDILRRSSVGVIFENRSLSAVSPGSNRA